jgi:hypothetical protein
MKHLRLIHSSAPITPPRNARSTSFARSLRPCSTALFRPTCHVIDPYHPPMQSPPFILRAHWSSMTRATSVEAICIVHQSTPIPHLKGHSISLLEPPLSLSLCLSHDRFPDQNISSPQSTIQELIKKQRILGWLAFAGESGRKATAGERWSSSMSAQGRWCSSHRRIPSRPDGRLAGRQWKKPCLIGTIQSGCQCGGSAIAMACGSRYGTWSSIGGLCLGLV